ncbi:MAG: hypothetical protein U1E25_09465 [Methylocystis sp.]
MSVAEFDPIDSHYPRTLRARPAGVRASIGMGVGATLILLAALVLFPREPATAEHQNEAGAAPRGFAAPPMKISSRISVDAIEASALMAKPFGALDVAAPEFTREKKTVAVREGENGSGRVDTISIGQFAAGAPFMRVEIHQDIAEKEKTADFFLDMTRHAAQAGLNVARIGQPKELVARFGSFETAEIRLSQAATEGVDAGERNCLATRFIDGKLALEIAGLACGPKAKPIDRVALGCMLDRIAYAASPDKPELVDFFERAAASRPIGCENISRDDLTASIPAPQKNASRRGHGKTTRQLAQPAR